MISLRSLSVGYDRRILLEGVTCGFKASNLVTLIGRNGAGKSSLLRVIAGLDKPISGDLLLCCHSLASLSALDRAKTVSFVTTARVRVQSLRCRDLVAMGRAPYTGWSGSLGKSDWEKVDEAIALMGMEAYSQRTMDTMSDGECQRIMIARALAQDTPIMLLDEPTSFLDLPSRYELCMLLRSIAHAKNKCIMLSTHELDIALDISDTVALIDPPALLTGSPEEIAASQSIQHLFQNASIYFDPLTRKVNLK